MSLLSDRDRNANTQQTLTVNKMVYKISPKCPKHIPNNKSSEVAEMGDRLAKIGMGRKWGGADVGARVPI